ncbi:hypothetical protein RQP46_006671 [Phenoliferia psychrophenolica]
MHSGLYWSSFALVAAVFVGLVYRETFSSSSTRASARAKMGEQSLQQDTIVLFGDSITQQSWGVGGLGSVMANVYQRKRDVMNRGLSGYNTAWGIPVAKQWLPRVGESRPETSLMLIWFGANDAALPPSPQALTIPEFKANLHTILQLLTLPSSPFYSPKTKFLLLTPPPVDAATRNNELVSRNPPRVPDRDYEQVAAAITVHLPELHWDKLEQTFPHWADIVNHGALGPQYLEKK